MRHARPTVVVAALLAPACAPSTASAVADTASACAGVTVTGNVEWASTTTPVNGAVVEPVPTGSGGAKLTTRTSGTARTSWRTCRLASTR